jgi:plasmid replication initiation protein
VSHHHEIWGGELSNNRYVLICFNKFTIETVMTLNFTQIFKGRKVTSIREVIDKKNEEVHQSAFKTKVIAMHAVAMYVIGLEPQQETHLMT